MFGRDRGIKGAREEATIVAVGGWGEHEHVRERGRTYLHHTIVTGRTRDKGAL